MRIYKYPFDTTDYVSIRMPAGAVLRAVAVQGSTPCIWAEVDPGNTPETREFRVYGTGHELDATPQMYLGTYQLLGGALVFHVYELMPAWGEAR